MTSIYTFLPILRKLNVYRKFYIAFSPTIITVPETVFVLKLISCFRNFRCFRYFKGALCNISSLTDPTGFFLESKAVYLMKIHTRLPSQTHLYPEKTKNKNWKHGWHLNATSPSIPPVKQTTAPSMLCDWSVDARDAFAAGRAIWWLRSTLLLVQNALLCWHLRLILSFLHCFCSNE